MDVGVPRPSSRIGVLNASTIAWDRYLEHLAVTAPDILKRGQAEGMVGDMDDMRDWVRQRVDIGVEHIILNLHTPYSLESLENFSREVMPEFR